MKIFNIETLALTDLLCTDFSPTKLQTIIPITNTNNKNLWLQTFFYPPSPFPHKKSEPIKARFPLLIRKMLMKTQLLVLISSLCNTSTPPARWR